LTYRFLLLNNLLRN